MNTLRALFPHSLSFITAFALCSCAGASPALAPAQAPGLIAPASAPELEGVQRSGLVSSPPPATESVEEVTEAMRAFARDNQGRTLQLSVSGSTPATGLRVSCPGAVVCDADFDYRNYRGAWDGFGMYMSFSPDVIAHLHEIDAVREAFAYVNFDLGFPGLQTGPWRVTESHAGFRIFRRGAPEVSIDSVEGGRIRGTIIATIDGLRGVDTSCPQVMDDAPDMPGCEVNVAADFRLEIAFDLAIEDVAVLDCNAPENQARCG